MDAVRNRFAFPKIALLLLAAALLVAAPWQAIAQPTFSPSSTAVALVGSTNGGVSVSSSGAQITYNAVVTYSGATPWLSVNGGNTVGDSGSVGPFTTSNALTFGLGLNPPCYNCNSAAATVTLTATSPAGVSSVAIAVSWTPSSGGGGGDGGSTNSITASSASVTADTSAGGTPQRQLQLQTTSTSAISFTLASATPATWLTVSAGSSTVAATYPATLYFQFNAAGVPAGNNYTTVTINYGSSQSLSIPVTFSVLGSTSLSVSPPSIYWSYTQGGQVPSTFLTITTGTSRYSASVDHSTYPWILIMPGTAGSGNPAATNLYSIPTSLGLTVLYDTSATPPTAGTVGLVTISDTASPPNSATFSVTFNGGGNGSGTVTITPSPVTLNSALNAGVQAQATVEVTSTVGGNLSAALSNLTCSNTCMNVSVPANTTITPGNQVAVVIYGTPTGLAAATYSATLTVTVTSNGTSSQGAIQVNYVVGNGGSGGTTITVAPTSLTFSSDVANPTAIATQYVTIGDSGTYQANVTAGSQWLSLGTTSGTSNGLANPALLQVIATPSNLPVGTYPGTFTVVSSSGTTTVNATLQVFNGAVLYALALPGNSGSLNITANSGNISGSVPNLYVYSSETSSMNVTASSTTSWLSLQQTTGTTGSGNNGPFPLLFSPVNLPNGVYSGGVTFTSMSAANSPLTIPVTMSVTGSSVASGLAVSQSSISLSGTVNGVAATAQLGVTASNSTSFSASAVVTNSSVQWLTVSPQTGTATSSATFLTVIANPTTLTAGTYYGTITVTGGGSQATSQVTFVVGNSSGNGGNVVSTPTALTFNYQVNGSLPYSQSLSIANAISGTAQIPFTISATVSGSVANWLTASASGGATSAQTPGTVVVSVTPGTLPPAQYTGTVLITPTGGSTVSVGVTLNIQSAPTVSASPLQLTFSYQLGAASPASQPLQVSGSTSGLPYGVTLSTSSGTGWLSVDKTSGTTPAVLSVSVNPTGLAAGNTYSGTILVSGTGTAAGSSTVAVTLSVTAPYPTISSVLSGGSLASGPIAPGEIVTIKGTSLGPATAAQTTLDPTTGKVSTTLSGVQVLFNGYPSPLTYVSATQINCVVPYELAQLSSPYVQVRYLGQSSNTFTLTQAATAPAIFTASGTGAGQGAILNADYSYNGTGAGSRPAAAGSVVQIYMTGEGQTSPAGVTGKVTCPTGTSCTVSQLPVPLLLVGALVNNQPATITFYGEAPGFVAGVMQVDLIIPPNTPSGPASVVISVGSGSSQAGVTVAVQ